MIVWFVLIFVAGIIYYFYSRWKKKNRIERFEKVLKGVNNSKVCEISPLGLTEPEYVIPRDKIDEFLRRNINTAGVKKIVFKNGQEIDLTRKVQNQKGEYKQNDDGIVVWNTDEKSAPWVSVDFAPPLDPPTYPSDSGSSNSDSSPTDFSGGDFGGGGAGGDY